MAATLEKLKQLWVSGEVGPDTPVWTEGMETRTRVRDVPSLVKCFPGASLASPRAALLSDDTRWEVGGHRHRAAAVAAAAGECSPALVLDLLRELKQLQVENQQHKNTIDSLTSQRRLLINDKRRVRRQEDEETREISLAQAEKEAKDLVVELRKLVTEEGNRNKKENALGRLRGRNKINGLYRGTGRRGAATHSTPEKASGQGATSSPPRGNIMKKQNTNVSPSRVDATRSPPPVEHRYLRPDAKRAQRHLRSAVESISGGNGGIERDRDALVMSLAKRVVRRIGAPLIRLNTHTTNDNHSNGLRFDLCGKKIILSANGAGDGLLVRAGGGAKDLEEWLVRNRFWERTDHRVEKKEEPRLTEW